MYRARHRRHRLRGSSIVFALLCAIAAAHVFGWGDHPLDRLVNAVMDSGSSLVSSGDVEEASEESGFGTIDDQWDEGAYYASSIPEELDSDFQRVCRSLTAGNRTVWVRTTSDEEVEMIGSAVQEIPELYWVDLTYTYSTWPKGTRMRFSKKYRDVEKRQEAIDAATEEALSLITPEMDDFDKTVVLHDWICDRTTYAENFDGSDQDLSGVFYRGQAVCAGYAEAYAYLLNKAGVECVCIPGYYGGEAHEWVRTTIDGTYYYTDVTGDDDDEVSHGRFWLNLTADMMLWSHEPDYASSMYESLSDADVWYVRTGTMLYAMDDDALISILAAQDGAELDVGAESYDVYVWMTDRLSSADMPYLLEASGHDASSWRVLTSDGAWGARIELS